VKRFVALVVASCLWSLLGVGTARAEGRSPPVSDVARREALSGAPKAPGPRKVERREPAVEWNPRWAKFRTWEFVLTAAQGVAALAAQGIPGGPRWTQHNGFDDAARTALRAHSLEGARTARDISDAGLVLLVNQRLVDDVFVAWWYHGKGSVAWQMSLIDAETLSFATAVNSIVAGAVGRQRPYAETTCNRPIEKQTANCTGANRYRSFFSGHTTASFTLAGLTCMHHAYLPLYQNRVADGAACAVTMTAAATVGMMRVVSDQHYLSDVLVGAAFGTASGLGLPWLLHYRGGGAVEESDAPKKAPAITATVLPAPNGIFVMGSF
jgi:membrane-associated phospholipid phosphatase